MTHDPGPEATSAGLPDHGQLDPGPPDQGLVAPQLLAAQMEAVHAASAGITVFSLLPAIQVAWADGTIQKEERELILGLMAESGLTQNAAAVARLTAWLESPPSAGDTAEAVASLRGGFPGRENRAMQWARAVAQAEGGLLGFGAISAAERRQLAWLDSALNPAEETSQELWEGAFEVLLDLLDDWRNADTRHVNLVPPGEQAMWPQPSPLGATRMPPAVFGVPRRDYDEFLDKIIRRYVHSLTSGWWSAVRLAHEQPGVAPMDDRELARLVFETPFSRFLTPTLDPPDRLLFADWLPVTEARGALYKIDFSHLASWKPLPGIQLAPTVALFALDEGRLRPLAIAVRGRLFRPEDGESWARARYFLLQGCSLSLSVGIHGFLHFPMDSVIAVTREALPPSHPIAQLIEAHSYLHLPLNYGVLWNVRSVAHNHQNEVYTPFPARREHVFQGVSDFYGGIEGNSGYPGFRYPMAAPEFPGPYALFLRNYYEVVLAFCRDIARALPAAADPALDRWGDTLSGILPGFPAATALREPETLARALAGFVFSVSIWHCSEHHGYAAEPVNRVPQRLRVPEPVGNDLPVPPAQWTRRVDLVRQELARRMFYDAHTLRSITEVHYGFTDPAMQRAARDFFEALGACDRAQPRRYLPLDRLACSLQF